MIKRPFPSLFVDHSDEIELHSFPLRGEPRFQGSRRLGAGGGALTEAGWGWGRSLNSMRSDRRLGDLGSGRAQRKQGHCGDTASPTEQGLAHVSGLS